MIYVGIDPGAEGGIVAVDGAGSVVAQCRMPRVGGSKGRADGAAAIRWLLELAARWPLNVALEAPQIRGGESGRSALTIGIGWGELSGGLIAMRIAHITPHAATWKKGMGLPTRSPGIPKGTPKATAARMRAAAKDKRKADAIKLARQMLPDLDLTTSTAGNQTKPSDGVAEAGLLALFCRRTMGGDGR